MRQIKASEVKPGMTIQFDLEGWDVKGTVGTVTVVPYAVRIYTEKWREISLELDAPVTVLAEAQPEEPQEFGARVRVRDGRFVRLDWRGASSRPWYEEGTGYLWTWDDLCEMGPVTVIPDQGWTVPADIPGVPDRIEEWPEDDTALRPYPWRDRDGGVWKWIAAVSEWKCYDEEGYYLQSGERPSYGPWIRVSGA